MKLEMKIEMKKTMKETVKESMNEGTKKSLKKAVKMKPVTEQKLKKASPKQLSGSKRKSSKEGFNDSAGKK